MGGGCFERKQLFSVEARRRQPPSQCVKCRRDQDAIGIERFIRNATHHQVMLQ